jgi:membrane fusion protein, multidrug efflux system
MKLRTGLILVLPVAIAAGALVHGITRRETALDELEHVAEEQAVPPVEILSPQPGPTTRPLILPGTVRAWYEAPIFAQVAGYVRSWDEDYGATVTAGQLLATIDAPSLDAQYEAAKANLAVADANYRLAASTAARWQALAATPAVSKQEVDVQVAGAAARKAELASAEQNVARYAALEAFKRVVAPFDGVVTARLTDVGNYVNTGGGDAGARATSTALFSVADIHKMRVFVSVPQDDAAFLKPGLTASFHLPSEPDKAIEAKLLTSANAFNENTRTAVTELTVDNPDRRLWPGTYVDVEFQVPTDPTLLTIPEQALIFGAAGTQAAVVDPQNRVHLRAVTLGQNLGKTIQVIGGLLPGDRLVNNPSAGLLEGQEVRPVAPVPGDALASKLPDTANSVGVDGGIATR